MLLNILGTQFSYFKNKNYKSIYVKDFFLQVHFDQDGTCGIF